LSAVVLYSTSATQALVSDGHRSFGVVYWHIPFYGTKTLSDSTWWIFVHVWLFSLLVSAVLWILVGTRELVSRLHSAAHSRSDNSHS
jgi:hypothetical protein